MQYEERAALLLSNHVIYTSWTSHCDHQFYTGWVMAYSQSTLQQTAVLNVAPNSGGMGPAIWMAGGGPAADSAGSVYLLTGNGAFEENLDGSGFPNQRDFGNSFLRLSTSGGSLAVADYFALSNTSYCWASRHGPRGRWHHAAPDRWTRSAPPGTWRGCRQGRQRLRGHRDSMGDFSPSNQQHLATVTGVLGNRGGCRRRHGRHLVDPGLLQRPRVLRLR